LARGLGRGSSAASKYYQILCEDSLQGLNPTLVVSLADGCGGVLAKLLHLYPLASGVFNTLMDDEVLGISEPSMYIPSALIGCGITSRLLNLPRSVTVTTDITKSTTQNKIISISHEHLDRSEVLLTMDAESSKETNWTPLLSNSLRVLSGMPFQRKTAIIKLIVPPEDMNFISEFTIREMAALGLYHRWSKPITSHARNNEIFLIISDWIPLFINLPEQVKYMCHLASSMANIGEFFRIGLRLKSAATCLNISRQNLKELTLLEPTTITPRKLLDRIRSTLSALWEELEVDKQYTNQVRKYGRTQALLRMVAPLIVLYHFWIGGRSGIVKMFLKLSSVKMVVVRQVDATPFSPIWPYTSTFGVRIDQSSDEESTIRQTKKIHPKSSKSLVGVARTT